MALFNAIGDQKLLFPKKISSTLKDLLRGLLMKDPHARYTLAEAMEHDWLKDDARAGDLIMSPTTSPDYGRKKPMRKVRVSQAEIEQAFSPRMNEKFLGSKGKSLRGSFRQW
eukprot:CAMPEP_0185754846 /NCGR_PEP_ID=MMETSP1174-20130828/13435_1 /TAXON_ID=35687 /ORGANISM="Dictyocha speculum, Strain CCMP1381" /LENGTH=111 /DNA_ID=CAMNT_0028433221 /DNA_START=131 /DNA_END=463 /DNA_ORIENTATION=-